MRTLERPIAVECDDYRLVLEYEGEGYSGEYDPDDPNDDPLLRFRLYVKGQVAQSESERTRDIDYDPTQPDEWHDYPGGTYCTHMDARVSDIDLVKLAGKMLAALLSNVRNGESIQRTCASLSWTKAAYDNPGTDAA